MAQIVPIGEVSVLHDMTPTSYSVRKMRVVLEKQGQIEPLQVMRAYGRYFTFHDDPHGTEIVHAARQLGWPTLLVVEMKAYDKE